MNGAGYDFPSSNDGYYRELDRSVDRIVANQPRFGVVRYADGSTYAVWDHQTGTFHPVSELLAPLFVAVGLGVAQ